jgi:hypothetical protein
VVEGEGAFIKPDAGSHARSGRAKSGIKSTISAKARERDGGAWACKPEVAKRKDYWQKAWTVLKAEVKRSATSAAT